MAIYKKTPFFEASKTGLTLQIVKRQNCPLEAVFIVNIFPTPQKLESDASKCGVVP
jgi:hypothetical protein